MTKEILNREIKHMKVMKGTYKGYGKVTINGKDLYDWIGKDVRIKIVVCEIET